MTDEGDEVDMAVSPSPPLSLSVILGEEADDLSPRSISMLEAEEGREGKQVWFSKVIQGYPGKVNR